MVKSLRTQFKQTVTDDSARENGKGGSHDDANVIREWNADIAEFVWKENRLLGGLQFHTTCSN